MAEEKNIIIGGGELVTNCDRFKNLKHSTVCPFAFTEQGVAISASGQRVCHKPHPIRPEPTVTGRRER